MDKKKGFCWDEGIRKERNFPLFFECQAIIWEIYVFFSFFLKKLLQAEMSKARRMILPPVISPKERRSIPRRTDTTPVTTAEKGLKTETTGAERWTVAVVRKSQQSPISRNPNKIRIRRGIGAAEKVISSNGDPPTVTVFNPKERSREVKK